MAHLSPPHTRRNCWSCFECENGFHENKFGRGNWRNHIQIFIATSKIFVLVSTAFLVAAMAALDVGDYPWSWSAALRTINTCRLDLGDEAFSAGHIIISCIAFTIAATSIYRINIFHLYQDHFLFAGITSGVGIGFIFGGGLQAAIFTVMPWMIMLSLLCSIIFHAYLPHRSTEVEHEKAALLVQDG
jgi:hypothetical protein